MLSDNLPYHELGGSYFTQRDPERAPELARLLRAFVLPKPVTVPERVMLWSRWRRRRQHRAAACHHRWNEVTAAA
ncbi:hypothetical protein ACFWBR_31320 [Streptomyces sp. NPDC060006]|uniref:hypothetical protein n=1 Tax=unclassified Streptomyces TaxID=2593676 RepID=UPI0036765F0C